ncbi:MAG: carboxymuconolactone decarboxylase family protein [Methanomicrobiales archaeon]|nr:carboxymuconolactone decarboxylase family protein [Methanomicrobiales archaeon]
MKFEELLEDIAREGVENTARAWLQEVEQDYGKVPLIFRRMAERPEILISHLLYKGAIAGTGTLDPKTVELISLAVGAALKCPHCVEYHVQSAMRRGATRGEILEVILITGLLANAAILANAYRIIDRELERCASCEVNGVSLDSKTP